MKPHPGKIILFPVPMGDAAPASVLPASNIDMLRGVRYFAVENLRSARRFLRAAAGREFDIDACTFTELSEHTPAAAVDAMLAPALQGHDIGVISEAGCPAVADPGADIVACAQRSGLKVVPLVGPSSIIMSLMASGLNGQRFAFEGYLPIEGPARNEAIRAMDRDAIRTGRTHIFIETPYRNLRLLQQLATTLSPSTLLCVATDIGGPAECIRTLPAARWSRTDCSYVDRTPTIFLIGSHR